MNTLIIYLFLFLYISISIQTCPTNTNKCKSLYIPSYLYDNLYSNLLDSSISQLSACASCTGLGNCINNACSCRQPTTGIFRNINMISGNDCSNIRSIVTLDTIGYYIYNACGIFVLFLAVVTFGFLVFSQDASSIRNISSILGSLTSLGFVAAAALIIVLGQTITNDWNCQSSVILVSLSYNLIFGSVFAQSYKYFIFESIYLNFRIALENEKGIITIKFLVFFVVALVFVDFGLFALIYYYSPYSAIANESANEYSVYITCTSSSNDALVGVIVILKICLTLWGLYLAFKNRNVSHVTLSARLSIVMVNFFVTFCSVIPCIYFFQKNAPFIILWVEGLTIFYLAVSTFTILYATRFYSAITETEEQSRIYALGKDEKTIRKEERIASALDLPPQLKEKSSDTISTRSHFSNFTSSQSNVQSNTFLKSHRPDHDYIQMASSRIEMSPSPMEYSSPVPFVEEYHSYAPVNFASPISANQSLNSFSNYNNSKLLKVRSASPPVLIHQKEAAYNSVNARSIKSDDEINQLRLENERLQLKVENEKLRRQVAQSYNSRNQEIKLTTFSNNPYSLSAKEVRFDLTESHRSKDTLNTSSRSNTSDDSLRNYDNSPR